MPMTITEALAELKTLDKRIEKKRAFVGQHLVRQDRFKDPLEKDGGQRTVIKQERQSIGDLERRAVAIRTAIADANRTTLVRLGDTERSIAEWLVWRREVAPGQQRFLQSINNTIQRIRSEAMQKGLAVSSVAEVSRPDDVIVNIDERGLADEMEALENTLGTLDGVLSLKNATVTIDV